MLPSTPSPSLSPTSHEHVETPVLISGAGPVGLFAAILLTKLNIPCRLIERQLVICPLSKALVIQARTMELFALSGILGPFLERGRHLSDFHAYNGAKHMAVLPALANNESHYGFGLFLTQLWTVDIMNKELEELGMKVDRGWELMDTKVVEQGNTSWVETTIRRAIVGTNVRQTESKVLGVVDTDPEEEGKKYETQVVKSNYLIAADGGKSVVRHKLNIAFPGRTLDRHILIYDGHVESDIPLNHITLTPEEHAALKPEDLTLEKFEALAAACVAPAKFKCLDSSWLTYYRVNERQAEHFSYKNRIFLAGDAAHVHSPAGGQGMNLGLQDSLNLAWKMALVLQGLAPEKVLETYEIERKPVAEAIIKLSSIMLENIMAQDIFRRTFRRVLFTVAPYVVPYIDTNINPVTMLAIHYHENAINQCSKSQLSIGKDYQVGHRARDGDLRVVEKHDMGQAAVEGTVVRLHELLPGPGIFHVIVFASDMLLRTPAGGSSSLQVIKGVETTNATELAKEIDAHLTAWRSKWAYKPGPTTTVFGGETAEELTQATTTAATKTSATASLAAIPHQVRAKEMFMVHVVASDLGTAPEKEPSATAIVPDNEALEGNKAGEGKLYLDHLGVVHQKYGVEAKRGPGTIVVLRPDSYIGYRVMGVNKAAWTEVNQYFESILIK
ncbi:hypothetical protein EDD11_008508 [Mortierella claussenii]|nr:hypothetical protein EDD11_008508 [Mortierella claussenii]